MAKRRTSGYPRHETRIDTNFENRKEFALIVGVETGFLHVGVGVMGAEAQHNAGLRPIHDEGAEPVAGQRDSCVGDLIEVDEVCAEVFERKKSYAVIGKIFPMR